MFSVSRSWEDMADLLRARRQALLAVAGVFFFLPNLAVSLFVPEPGPAKTPAEFATLLVAYFQDNWAGFGAAFVVSQIGMLAILHLLLGTPEQLVGNALKRAFLALPSLVGLWLVTAALSALLTLGSLLVAGLFAGLFGGGMAVRVFFILLALVPLVWLYGRTLLAVAVIAGDPQPNPVEALIRSFRMTQAIVWRLLGAVFALLLGAMLAGGLLSIMATTVSFVLPDPFGRLLILAASAVSASLGSLVGTLFSASAYRQISARGSASQ